MNRKIFLIILIVCLLLGSCSQEPVSILFIGNSQTHSNGGMDVNFNNFAVDCLFPVPVQTTQLTQSMSTLAVLWNVIPIREAIETGDYDYVVIQGSVAKAGVESFAKNSGLFIDLCKEAGSVPLLYMTYEKPESTRDNWLSQELIHQYNFQVAEEHNISVIPAGDILWEFAKEEPELQMIKDDHVHPSIIGSYLITSVMYTYILGRNPTRTRYVPDEFNLVYGESGNIVTPEIRDRINAFVWAYYNK